jgi:hypothetical protein
MGRFSITIGVALACAFAASSSAFAAAKWPGDPTCTATTTALTCTGKAAGLHPRFIYGLSPVEVAIKGEVHYTCTDPVFDFDFYGGPTNAPLDHRYLAATFDFHNGKTFSVEFVPPAGPPGISALAACPGGYSRPDLNYYDLKLVVGWGFGSGTPIEALAASIGTVSPG